MQKIGLYFGSFNPIHKGHLAIAEYVLKNTPTEEVWFIVSPHNPLKNKNILSDKEQRLQQVKQAIAYNKNFVASDVEFSLPKPSYTVDTLEVLNKKYKNSKEFALIMGGDNLKSITLWKDYQKIVDNYTIYVYPRGEDLSDAELSKHPNVKIFWNAPFLNISSTMIREKQAL